jgi:protein phosphatase/protein phosphatase PTC1
MHRNWTRSRLLTMSVTISIAEEMNPSRRNTMEDVHVVHIPGTWKCPNMTYLGVYDGHGGEFS